MVKNVHFQKLIIITMNQEIRNYVSRTMSPMMVAEYQLQLSDKEILQKKLNLQKNWSGYEFV